MESPGVDNHCRSTTSSLVSTDVTMEMSSRVTVGFISSGNTSVRCQGQRAKHRSLTDCCVALSMMGFLLPRLHDTVIQGHSVARKVKRVSSCYTGIPKNHHTYLSMTNKNVQDYSKEKSFKHVVEIL